MTSEYQKMIAGEAYRPSDPELQEPWLKLLAENSLPFNKEEDPWRESKSSRLGLGQPGQNIFVNPRLVVDYGINIPHLG